MAELHVDVVELGMVRVPPFVRNPLAVHRLTKRQSWSAVPDDLWLTNCGRRAFGIRAIARAGGDARRIPISHLCFHCFGRNGVTSGHIRNGVLIFRLFSQPTLDD